MEKIETCDMKVGELVKKIQMKKSKVGKVRRVGGCDAGRGW